MRFLLDQDIYAATVHFLKNLGHDVLVAAQLGLSQAADSEVLNAANKDRRIMVTRDRDFGGLVHVEGVRTGVIYLRLSPATLHAAHDELNTVLTIYSEEVLLSSFVVIAPGRHRIRRFGGENK